MMIVFLVLFVLVCFGCLSGCLLSRSGVFFVGFCFLFSVFSVFLLFVPHILILILIPYSHSLSQFLSQSIPITILIPIPFTIILIVPLQFSSSLPSSNPFCQFVV